MLPLFIRLVCSEMLEVLSSEYIKFGKAKGLALNKIYYQHALKNTHATGTYRWWCSDWYYGGIYHSY